MGYLRSRFRFLPVRTDLCGEIWRGAQKGAACCGCSQTKDGPGADLWYAPCASHVRAVSASSYLRSQ